MSKAGSNGADKSRRLPMLVVAVLLGISVVAAGGFGVSWAVAANSSAVELAGTRDRALDAGRQAVINVKTLDHKHIERDLDRAVESTTGPLHEALKKQRKKIADALKKNKSTAKAKIVGSALTELNERAGKGRMIALVETTETLDGGKPSVTRSRMNAQISRTKQGWKLSRLTPERI